MSAPLTQEFLFANALLLHNEFKYFANGGKGSLFDRLWPFLKVCGWTRYFPHRNATKEHIVVRPQGLNTSTAGPRANMIVNLDYFIRHECEDFFYMYVYKYGVSALTQSGLPLLPVQEADFYGLYEPYLPDKRRRTASSRSVEAEASCPTTTTTTSSSNSCYVAGGSFLRYLLKERADQYPHSFWMSPSFNRSGASTQQASDI